MEKGEREVYIAKLLGERDAYIAKLISQSRRIEKIEKALYDILEDIEGDKTLKVVYNKILRAL